MRFNSPCEPTDVSSILKTQQSFPNNRNIRGEPQGDINYEVILRSVINERITRVFFHTLTITKIGNWEAPKLGHEQGEVGSATGLIFG